MLIALLLASKSRAAERAPGTTRVLLLVGAITFGTLFQIAVLHLEPQGAAATWAERTYDPAFTSFFSMAVETNDLAEETVLSHYDAILHEAGDLAFHAATHPPAGVLFYRTLIRFFRHRPAVTSAASDALGWFGVNAGRLVPVDAPARTRSLPYPVAAITGGLLLALMGALACVPLTFAAEALGASPLAASRVGILWCLCPAIANFSPYLDQALVFFTTSALAFLLIATRRSSRHALAATAAGVAFAAASLVSYGAIGMAAVVAVAVAVSKGLSGLGRTAQALTIAGLTACALLLFLRVVGFNYLASATAALTLHRAQYTVGRSYGLWLGFNVIDFTVFAGLPVIIFGLAACAARWAQRRSRVDDCTLLVMGAFAGLALLDATGTVRGEVGRIWIPLMPMFYLGLLGCREQSRPELAVSRATVTATLLVAFTVTLRLRWGP
jgi:hypothetical protein